MLTYGNHCYSCQSPVRQLIPAFRMSPETPDSSIPNRIHSSSKATPRVQTLVSPHQWPRKSLSEWRTRALLFLSAVRHHRDELHAAANKSALAALLPRIRIQGAAPAVTGRDRNCTPSRATHVLAVNWRIINCKRPSHISDRPQWRVRIYGGKDKTTQVSDGKWPNVCVFGPRRFFISLHSLPQTVIVQSLQANIPQLG